MMPVGFIVAAVIEIVVTPLGHLVPLGHAHTIKPLDEYFLRAYTGREIGIPNNCMRDFHYFQ